MTRSRPIREFGCNISSSYGNYGASMLDGIMNFGTGDSFGGKLSGVHREQSEGRDNVLTRYGENVADPFPCMTFTIGGNCRWRMGLGDAVVRGGLRDLGSHEVDFANKPEVPEDSQNLVDASANDRTGNWTFSVVGRNLLEEDGYQTGFDVAGL